MLFSIEVGNHGRAQQEWILVQNKNILVTTYKTISRSRLDEKYIATLIVDCHPRMGSSRCRGKSSSVPAILGYVELTGERSKFISSFFMYLFTKPWRSNRGNNACHKTCAQCETTCSPLHSAHKSMVLTSLTGALANLADMSLFCRRFHLGSYDRCARNWRF